MMLLSEINIGGMAEYGFLAQGLSKFSSKQTLGVPFAETLALVECLSGLEPKFRRFSTEVRKSILTLPLTL